MDDTQNKTEPMTPEEFLAYIQELNVDVADYPTEVLIATVRAMKDLLRTLGYGAAVDAMPSGYDY